MIEGVSAPPTAAWRALGFLLAALTIGGCENGNHVADPGNGSGTTQNPQPGVPLAPLSTGEMAIATRITKAKCNRCHKHDERVGLMKSPGFETTRRTLPPRLTPEAYQLRIDALKKDSLGAKAYKANTATIEAIQAETDPDKRIEMWMQAYLKNTKFDHPKNKMLKVVLDDDEIAILVRYVMNEKP